MLVSHFLVPLAPIAWIRHIPPSTAPMVAAAYSAMAFQASRISLASMSHLAVLAAIRCPLFALLAISNMCIQPQQTTVCAKSALLEPQMLTTIR